MAMGKQVRAVSPRGSITLSRVWWLKARAAVDRGLCRSTSDFLQTVLVEADSLGCNTLEKVNDVGLPPHLQN